MSDIEIADESGDRKYFTMVPNYILNHSSGVDQALYLQMKRCAGEGNDCFASEKYLQKQLGIGWKRLKRSLAYLLEHNWVYLKGYKIVQTRGGEQSIKVYGIRDLWKMNIEYYSKGVSKSEPLVKSAKRGLQKDVKGSLPRALSRTTNKNYNKNTAQASYEAEVKTADIPEVKRIHEMLSALNGSKRIS